MTTDGRIGLKRGQRCSGTDQARANADRGRLMMRRISLLIEAGDAAAMELLDKIMKLKPAKAVEVNPTCTG
jgi:hypothetical protein